ncbi:protein PET117 homolog, mitochondrial [Nilaparvata lugens]|uniref:protein PET117 homolog, mitochondrial n=1 Tax=Nilaparvata lugens TaxID=108931 RepID=UPI00193DD280|nr:protein PET117 homolog, mitochondrial [Nilaparvata lugens]
MSLASKLTFGLSCLASAGIVGYVHFKQTMDKERLHRGVIRDIETQRKRKIENVYALQKQSDLEKMMRDREDDNLDHEESIETLAEIIDT